MAKYQLIGDGSPVQGVKDTETGAFIPNAPGNRHWQEYLDWLEGSPENVPDPDPAYSGASLKAAKKLEINTLRETALNGGIEFSGNDYDSDQRSRDNLSGIVAHLAGGGSLPSGSPAFSWRTADNQNVVMDANTVKNLGAVMIDHVNTQYNISWDLKAQVDAISDSDPDIKSLLAAIVWPS